MSGGTPAKVAKYWGLPTTDLGEIDGPPVRDMGEILSPAEQARVNAEIDSAHAYGDPTDLGEIDARNPTTFSREAPSAPKPFSWNAPGYENVHQPAFSGGPPPTDLGELGGPPVGAPAAPPGVSLARPPAQPDIEQPKTTPEADRAARALAYYGGASSPARKPVGAGGGAPAGPSALKTAQAELLGTYDAEKKALQQGANAEMAKNDLAAEGGALIAQQKQVDAQNAQMEAAEAAQHFRTYQEETQRQIDDVRQQKIQPNRLYADSGSAALATIGGALGGLYQGLNHMTSNPFIDQMNKNIDRDIAAQESDLRTKKESISERKGLLAEMRGIYKDDALAKAQAKNLYYEAAKEDLLSQAAQYDSPAIQARADQGVAAITRAQAGLKLQQLQQEAAARAAAAAAAERQRQVDFNNRLEEYKAHTGRISAEGSYAKDMAEGGKVEAGEAQRFVATGKDAQGNPTGYLGRNAEEGKERENARIAAQKLIAKIDRVQEIRNGQGTLGRTINRQDPSQAIQLYTPEWQTQLRALNAEMTTDWAHAKNLGALSDSDRKLADGAIGDLESRGSQADERLNELRRTLQKSLEVEDQQAAGARATKVIGPDGRERIIVQGNANAPNNPRSVVREPVK